MNKKITFLMAALLGASAPWLTAQNPGPAPTETPERPADTTEMPGAQNGNESPPADRPTRPAFVEGIETIQNERRAIQQDLVSSREALLLELEASEATEEEIREALDSWRSAHLEQFEQLQALQQQLMEHVQAARPDRQVRPGPDAEVQSRREEFRAVAAEIAERRRAAKDALDAAQTAEERRAILDGFREEQRERMDEQKELRRAERRGGEQAGGARRPDA